MPRYKYRPPRQPVRVKIGKNVFWKALSVASFVLSLVIVIQRIQSVRKVEALLQPVSAFGCIPKPPSYDPVKQAERKKRAYALHSFWKTRIQRDVTLEVAPFLYDSDLRASAMRILARLNTSAAEIALTQYAADNHSNGLPLNLSMALGRAQAYDLKGWAKVQTAANGANLSFDELVMLSERINERKQSEMRSTLGYTVMCEMIDLLGSMAKQGENIEPIVSQLTLNPIQRGQLKAASLPEAEGTRMVLDYIASLDVVNGEAESLKQSLINNTDSITTDVLVQKLQDIYEGQGKMGRSGYIEIFRTADRTGDTRVFVLLKRFEQSNDSRMAGYAMQSRMTMESQFLYPPLP